MALAAALFCGGGSASAVEMAIAYPTAPAPIVTIRGNAVVNSANKPNGTYELALCVQTHVYTYVGNDATKAATLTPEEYNVLTDAEKADYRESNNPFESVSASVVVDLDALTPIKWDVDVPTYATWNGTSYDANNAGYTPAGGAATGYARGIDTTALLGTVIPDVTGATLGRQGRVVALDTAKPDEVGTAQALVEGYTYDPATGKTLAVVSLSANVPHSAKGRTYDKATEVVVVRFAYDMKRFPNTKLSASGSDFNVELDAKTTPRTVTYLASDAEAAQTATGQGVWYQSNTDQTGATQRETMHYYYRAGDATIPATNGKTTLSIDEDTLDSRELDKPDTAGKTVLTHDAADAANPYSLTRNLLKTHDQSLRFTYVNQTTYREAKGTGGAQVLFYDWDDALIGTLVVDPEGDVRAQVNEYVEQNLVHPDLRSGKVLEAMGGEVPDYASLTTPTADQTKYQNLCDSLERQYTYRGKYPYTVGGSVTQDDPDALPGEEYPLTNKLDYAFYRRVTTATEATDPATSTTNTYFTTQKVSETGENDENLYPYVYGWAVVEDLSAKNAQDWQVRRDAAKVSSVWTTVGVGELSGVDPQTAAQGIPGAAADPITGLTPQYTFSTSAAAGNDYLQFADFSDMEAMLTKTVRVGGKDVTFTKDTLIVKAVYEPGPELLEGYNYQMIEEPAYNKLNDLAASAGGAYSATITLERASQEMADGLVRGVNRVRAPAIRQDNTYDQKWIANELLGVDHDLPNASISVATNRTETLFTKVDVDNGEEITFTLPLSARHNKVDYYTIETYGWNFVAGGYRSASNYGRYGTSHTIDNYNYDSEDRVTADSYYDRQNYYYQVTDYENREGSHGFVLYGTLNYLMQQAAKLNNGEIDRATFNSGSGYMVLRDANLRLDAAGSIIGAGTGQNEIREKIIAAAKACEAHKGNAEYWNDDSGYPELSFHQLQWFIIDGKLYGRAEADSKLLPFCHLHKACADLSSDKPTDWFDLIDKARTDPDTIEQLRTDEIETMTHLRKADGAAFSSAQEFKTDLVAAVTAGCTSWDDIQYHIINKTPPTDGGAAARATYWWYDGSTAKPGAPGSLAGLVGLLDDYLTPPTLVDGSQSPRLAKLDAARKPYDDNAAVTDVLKPAKSWINMTGNLVAGHAESVDNDGVTVGTVTRFPTYEDFTGKLIPAVEALSNAGLTPATDAGYWWKLQYLMLDSAHTLDDFTTDPNLLSTIKTQYWWKDGKKLLVVTNVRTLLQAALQAQEEGGDATPFNAVSLEDISNKYYIRKNKTGDPFDTLAEAQQAIKDAANAGATDWVGIQYYIINDRIEADTNDMLKESQYYWWADGGTGTMVDIAAGVNMSDKAERLIKAIYRSTNYGDPKALDQILEDGSNAFAVTRLLKTPAGGTATAPALPETDIDETARKALEFTSRADLITAVTQVMEAARTAQGITDSYTLPSLTWFQLQYGILNGGTLLPTTDPVYKTLKDVYWWQNDDTFTAEVAEDPSKDMVGWLQTYCGNKNATTLKRMITNANLAAAKLYMTIDGDPWEGNKPQAAAKNIIVALGKELATSEYYDTTTKKLTLGWAQIQYYLVTGYVDGKTSVSPNAELLSDAEALYKIVHEWGWTKESSGGSKNFIPDAIDTTGV